MHWWEWAFDGVGGAVAVAVVTWAVSVLLRRRAPDTAPSQSVVATNSTVYQAARDLHVHRAATLSDEDVQRIADAVLQRMAEMGWRFRLLPDAFRLAVRRQLEHLQPGQVDVLVEMTTPGARPEWDSATSAVLTEIATALLATNTPPWRLGERRGPAGGPLAPV